MAKHNKINKPTDKTQSTNLIPNSSLVYLKWINFRVKIPRGFGKNCNLKNFAWTKFAKLAKIRENREN